VRVRFGALVVGFALVLCGTGCTTSATGAPRTPISAHPAPSPTREPAEAAGGACQLLSFDQVTANLGADFGVAAASNVGETYTCVLRRVDAPLPDLSLAVTPTVADPTVFSASVTPKGAAVVGDLGKLGYSRPVPAAAGAGPGAEVGWLSANQRLMTLRYRSAPGTAAAELTALIPGLVALAKKTDQMSG